jgi:hypothetical protein
MPIDPEAKAPVVQRNKLNNTNVITLLLFFISTLLSGSVRKQKSPDHLQ